LTAPALMSVAAMAVPSMAVPSKEEPSKEEPSKEEPSKKEPKRLAQPEPEPERLTGRETGGCRCRSSPIHW
jgi:hypothetical protein